jgi:heme-degrading monooxygenase HmoA
MGNDTAAPVADPGSVGGTGRVVTVFRSRVRPEAVAEYEELAPRIEALARAMPGFCDFATFGSVTDDERVSIVVFESFEAQRAWRDHPEHRRAQDAGRQRLFESYSIHVCHERHFHRLEGHGPTPASERP